MAPKLVPNRKAVSKNMNNQRIRKQLPHLRLRKHQEEEAKRLSESEDQELHP